jgi:hypothetical protein
MAERGQSGDFTVYLEGHDGHRGNVLLRAFRTKLHRIELVLNKLERAYLRAGSRRSDFEIIDADKSNPTSVTLRVVPHVQNYNPRPAFEWGMTQIATVGRGDTPDPRVTSDIANDLALLATKDSEVDYRAFWINGHAEPVRFDDQYRENAARLAREKKKEEEETTRWHTGAALGSVVGVLKRVDDIDEAGEFVIVPPVGAETITCTFPESMKESLGGYLFKRVRVSGTLRYNETSPFPYRVDAAEDGIELYPPRPMRRTLSQLRGVFAGLDRDRPDWDSILNDR